MLVRPRHFLLEFVGGGRCIGAVRVGPDARPLDADAAAEASPTKPAASATATAVARKWTEGYPNSIAVLGHSQATGESSDPDQPGVEVRENSWATGTNPTVDSLYLRLLSHNPDIEGNNTNLAQGGATVDELALQADELLGTESRPELIVVQIMDNDMVCPAPAAALSEFQSKLASTLSKLAKGAPDSAIFVVSQIGSPTDELKTLTPDDPRGSGRDRAM